MNAQSGTFPVLSTRISGASPSYRLRKRGGYTTRNDTFAGLACGWCPSLRMPEGMPHHAGGTTAHVQRHRASRASTE